MAGRRAACGRDGHVERVRVHGLPASRVALAGAVGRVARGVHGRGQGIGVVHGPIRIHARHRQRAVRAVGHGHRGVLRHFHPVVVQLAVFHLQFGAADGHRGVRAVQLHVERAVRRGSEGLRGRRLVLRPHAGDVALVRGHHARAARGGVVEQRAFGHYHFFNDSLLFLHASVAVSFQFTIRFSSAVQAEIKAAKAFDPIHEGSVRVLVEAAAVGVRSRYRRTCRGHQIGFVKGRKKLGAGNGRSIHDEVRDAVLGECRVKISKGDPASVFKGKKQIIAFLRKDHAVRRKIERDVIKFFARDNLIGSIRRMSESKVCHHMLRILLSG